MAEKPTVKYLRECFTLLPGGVLLWRVRPPSHFSATSVWAGVNQQRAGTIAGCVGKDDYVVVRVADLLFPAHVVVFAMTHGRYPDGEIDHRDRNRTNNDPRNLRDATRPQNMWNTVANRDNRCGVKGVTEYRPGSFRARIVTNGRAAHLGVFKTAKAAGKAFEAASRKRGIQNV